MASTLTVDNIVGATTAGNVKIPGTIVQVVGRTGGDRIKTRNLEILKMFPEKNLILVKGAVPGHKGAYVVIEK